MSTKKRPFLTRANAASIAEFKYYATGIPVRALCRILQRHERTIKSWITGEAVIPPWAVAVLRLRQLEHELMKDQMGITTEETGRRTDHIDTGLSRRPAANEQHFATQLTLDIAN